MEKLTININKKLEYIKNFKIEQSFGLIIKNLYCGVCSSDLKIIREGHTALSYPRTPGHEIVGQILKIGDTFSYLREEKLREGDIVQVYPGMTCGECKYCKTGRENLCKNIKIIGFNYDGGFSSHLNFSSGADIIHLTKLEETEAPYLYTLTEPISSCINVLSNIKIYPTDTLLIIGAGPMGQLLSLTADYYGIKHQSIIDFNFERVPRSIPSNPEFIKITAETEIATIKDIKPDIVIIATSNFLEHNKLVEVSPEGSRICYFSGLSQSTAIKNLNFNLVHYREISIKGFYGSTPDQNRNATKVIGKYRSFFKSMIGEQIFTLKEYKKALKNAYSHRYSKVIFKL